MFEGGGYKWDVISLGMYEYSSSCPAGIVLVMALEVVIARLGGGGGLIYGRAGG